MQTMTPKEKQDIKDRASREKHKGFKLLQWQEDGYPPINLNDRLTDVIDLISGYNYMIGEVAQLEEELAAKRENEIDWEKLRNEFFKDNTRTREMGVTGDFAMTDFKGMPHNVFEWFRGKLGNGKSKAIVDKNS